MPSLSAVLDTLHIAESSHEAELIKFLYERQVKKNKASFLNPELDQQIQVIPVEVFWHILLFTSYKDWYHACLVSKSWHEKLSERFTELKTLYQTYREASGTVLLQEAKDSEEVATMLFMSDLVDKIDFDNLIAVASHKPSHLKTLFRRDQFFSRHYIPDNKSRLQGIKDYNLIFDSPGEFRSKTLLTLAQASPQNAEYVIKAMVNFLNGYTLMNIAMQSSEHAKIILSNKRARLRLKHGHLIGIAKKSLENTKLCLDSPEITVELGIQGLKEIIKHGYEQVVHNKILTYASDVPVMMVKNNINAISSVVSLLLIQRPEIFFKNKDSVLLAIQSENPELAKFLPNIVNMTRAFVSNNSITSFSLLRIALLSPEHLNGILLNSKTHKFFNEKDVGSLIEAGFAYAEVLKKLAPDLLEKGSSQHSLNTISL
jgi:hypothetical protein